MAEKENRPGEKQERSLRDIANDLRTEMRKRLDAETEIYLLTMEMLSDGGSCARDGEPETIPLTADMLEKHKFPLMDRPARFTHDMSAEEKERQELLMRAMPMGVIMAFRPDEDPNSGNEYPGEWEKVSELWERIK